MGPLGWTALIGALLLVTSLMSGWIQRGPITSFAIYLVAGTLVGPGVLGLISLDIAHDGAGWLRAATEVGMVISLFITGLKLRVPFRHEGWRTAVRLALPAMLLTVGGMALLVRWSLGWPWPESLALAAMISPTDPVLASLVSVDDSRDDDALRISLSGEAGLNDGTSLPLLFLALALLANGGKGDATLWGTWIGVDVVWDLSAGLAIGFGIGWGLGWLGTRSKHATQDVAPSDFLALGIMALVYSIAETLHASGFLAAFAAGVGLRWAEVQVVRRHPTEQTKERAPAHAEHAPAEVLVNPNDRGQGSENQPARSIGWLVSDALSFGDTLERLIAAALVMTLGIVAIGAFSWEGALLAAVLFVVVRPVAVWIATAFGGFPWQRRLLIGWLGIRGIGSLNYLAYALTHGFTGPRAVTCASLVVTIVALSVVVHGVTTTPLMNWRAKAIERKRGLS